MPSSLITRPPNVFVFNLALTLFLSACVVPPENGRINKPNFGATTKTAPLIQPERFGGNFVPLNLSSRKFGTGSCTTTLKGIAVRGNEVSLNVVAPVKCVFNKLDLVVGEKRFPLQALDGGFVEKGGLYTWNGNVESANFLFALDEPLTERATLGSFGLVASNCRDSSCLTDINSRKRAAVPVSTTQVRETTNTAQVRETTNRIGITMVDIPAGSFLMGSDSFDANADGDETPQHRVNIRSFQIGKTEVTVKQFKAFIKSAGRTDLVKNEFLKINNQGDSAPIVQVSWKVAQDFIKWLNKVDGGGYRLPSEAEWEYTCRAGGRHVYCGSNKIGDVAWYKVPGGFFDISAKGREHVYAVGQKSANAFGLYDMSGNVWEWVQDCYHANYRGAPDDGSAWETDCKNDIRPLRGGSWDSPEGNTRAANRSSDSPRTGLLTYGFRVARTVP